MSVTKSMQADRQRLFDVLADPAQHPLIDGSGSVKAVRPGGPSRLSLGATFSMDMRLGTDYRILNTVVEFDEPALIGWRHFNGHVWRYRFTEVPGGTEVTEEWDARSAQNRLALQLLRFPQRNLAGMTATLDRLAELATAPR
ncbi:SRPBCC family protein [Jatrophihabitans sp.]|uniref:SRPBCC family protein n=1 Tax=Jatrophihabitans sp. TaxID=1932789 RepID=UPI002EF1D0C9